MSPEKNLKLYTDLAKGNEEALDFLKYWSYFVHGIDDLIDGDIAYTPEEVIKRFFNGSVMYNCPFWQKYGTFLQGSIVCITNDYIDSHDTALHESQRDFLRSTGNNMLLLVAFITGGYDHMRSYSPLVRNLSYVEHHDDKGKPI